VNCVVTAGPTYECLDDVRRLTNFSTGQLGCELARILAERGHDVVLLKGYYAVHRQEPPVREIITFTTTHDLRARLQALASFAAAGAVFHAAAVSDFAFGRVFTRSSSGELLEHKAGKFSTRDGPLLAELTPTPKIIREIRSWFPRAQLTGWKYEVDGTREAALDAGKRQLVECETNACVVNGPAYGEGFGLLTSSGTYDHLPSRAALYECLGDMLRASDV
jgi:phosphopantothenate---cysteine ligase (CTP)